MCGEGGGREGGGGGRGYRVSSCGELIVVVGRWWMTWSCYAGGEVVVTCNDDGRAMEMR